MSLSHPRRGRYARRRNSGVIVLIGGFLTLSCVYMDTSEKKRGHTVTFKKIKLTDKFYCEGAHFGDFNRDGNKDVVIGPYWYAGPDFKKRHELRAVKAFDPLKYSDNFLTYVHDINGDGWDDILEFGWPGKKTVWYQNPKGRQGHWPRHVVYNVTDNESPVLTDLTGDDRPEIVFHTGGKMGWAEPDWNAPTKSWTFHALSPRKKYHRYTHGLGVGDINGDGRKDLLEATGWWEQPPSLAGDPVWKFHAHKFQEGRHGPSQMVAYDVDGDGDNDIVTALNAHGYGLAWFEHIKMNGKITFRRHLIMGSKIQDSPYGVRFSQLHALALSDIDGDGLKDIVTGKRYWAHGPKGDVEPNAPAVLYWFKLTRKGGKVEFVPHRIDDDSGVGTQVTVGDITGDGRPDVIVGNKKGSFLFIQVP